MSGKCQKCNQHSSTITYKDNKFEIEAEKFGQGIWKSWKRKFKKEELI